MADESVAEIVRQIDGESFAEWYREREWKRNIQNGTPYFNRPATVPAATRHTPSSLLQCHRKIAYRQENAPQEREAPEGIFWVGRRFEEDVVVPFLRDVITTDDTYVRNSLWVDFTVETPAGDLRFKGSTDPCLVDREGKPLLATEVKTKRSLDGLTEPNQHHRAQVQTYLRGLSEKYDRDVDDAVIIYGSRTSMQIQAFHESFDPTFWEDDVVSWASEHTDYRDAGDLPPAEPEYGWECQFCSYKHRCGQSDQPYSDVGVHGLLPLFDEYPRSQLEEYLQAHDTARLTPTLAHEHPDLATEFGVYPWSCTGCGSCYEWNTVDWSGDPSNPPICPACAADGVLVELVEPHPTEQQ